MIFENTILALLSLKANKMRALLTMLGIIIGIASVIAIVTIGNALTTNVSNNLSSFGTNNISLRVQEKSRLSTSKQPGNLLAIPNVMPGGNTRTRQGVQSKPEELDLISDNMINEFQKKYSNEILDISLEHSVGNATAKDKDLYANINVLGVNSGYFSANNITMLDGRKISQNDLDKLRNVVVVSDKFINNMFVDGINPIGQQVKVYKTSVIELYTIIGIYKYEQSNFSTPSTASEEDLTTNFYIPVTTSKQDLLSKNYQSVTVVAKPETDVIKFTLTINDYFKDVYKNNDTWNISATSSESMLENITSSLDSIKWSIAGIAFISLIVGGIGIMNIMLVSVTERTREIGTRKAMGAKNFHIRYQFVTEAIIISGIGGILGVLVGSSIGVVASNLMNVPVKISLFVSLLSVCFSMLIGIFFGYYPANKAAKLDPIEALRYE